MGRVGYPSRDMGLARGQVWEMDFLCGSAARAMGNGSSAAQQNSGAVRSWASTLSGVATRMRYSIRDDSSLPFRFTGDLIHGGRSGLGRDPYRVYTSKLDSQSDP